MQDGLVNADGCMASSCSLLSTPRHRGESNERRRASSVRGVWFQWLIGRRTAKQVDDERSRADDHEDEICVTFTVTTLELPSPEPQPALHRAAAAGDIEALVRILHSACDVDHLDEGGESALHLAAAEGHAEAVQVLLARGASHALVNGRANGTISAGWRPIHCAAQGPSVEVVALLLTAGADLHAITQRHVTPLHVAAFNGRLRATKLLLARGADPHAQDCEGDTAAAKARWRLVDCACQQPERKAEWGAVIALLERVMSVGDAAGRALAERSWQLDIAGVLIEAAESSDVRRLRGLLRAHAREVDAMDHDGTTALHAAAALGQLEATRSLLAERATVDAASHLGETPLHVAARAGEWGVAQCLLGGRADLHAHTRSGATPLDLTCRARRHEWRAVAALLRAHAPHAATGGGAAPAGALCREAQGTADADVQREHMRERLCHFRSIPHLS